MLCFEDFAPGQTAELGSLAVSEADLVAYARRFDPQDFHIDPQAAKASFVGTLIGSGWQSCSLLMRLLAGGLLHDSSGMGAPGIEEVKWLKPVLPGDRLSGHRRVLEVKESRSRPEMGLVRVCLTLSNGRGETVLEQTNWIMFGRRGTGREQPKGDWLAHPARYEPPVPANSIEPPDEAPEPARYFEDLPKGRSFPLGSFVFSAAEIVAFARSFDPQPFHLDETIARSSVFGGLAASGWHTASVWMACMVAHRRRQQAVTDPAHLPRLGPSPGVRNLRWTKPVLAGDRISYFSTLVDARASASRPEWGLLFHRNTAVNQRGEEVYSFDGAVFVERRPG